MIGLRSGSVRYGTGLTLIPPLSADGYLPAGRHAASLDEIHHVFVASAPHSDVRRHIFGALTTYAERVWLLMPGAKLWVDGGFVTCKAEPPSDVDVVIVVDPTTTPPISVDELMPLLTLENVTFTFPWFGVQERLQPMGGMVDGFLAMATKPGQLAYWDNWWTKVKNQPDSLRKGYLEVTQ